MTFYLRTVNRNADLGLSSVNLNSHFRPGSKMRKKTQHGVVGWENPLEDLGGRAQSIGDGFNALENAPDPRSTPNSRGERSD